MSSVRTPEPAFPHTANHESRSSPKRGKLTIFFGMAPGVGKTLAMLQAARDQAQAGREILLGFVQTHGSKPVLAVTKAFDQMPACVSTAENIAAPELDLDAILVRQPHVVVVDELAHMNPAGSRHPNRYHDVQELLSAGLDVFTTLNLQDIAGEAQKIERITGLKTKLTVPDNILDGAEIKLVDIPIETFQKRLRFSMDHLTQNAELSALDFFCERNLMTLREMSWRLLADHAARETRQYMHRQQSHGPWKSGPCLLAVASPDASAEHIVRWTRRIADSINAPWIVLYVETPIPLDESRHAQIARTLALAEELGAEVVTTTDDDLVQGVLRVASQRNVTQIVAGKYPGTRARLFREKPFLDRLLGATEDFEIHVVPVKPEPPEKIAKRRKPIKESNWTQYAISLAVVAVITVITFCFGSKIGGPYAGALIYLLGVVVLGSFASRGPTFMAATLSALLWDYLVLPPVFAFRIGHVQDFLLLGTYFIVAIILGQLTTQVRAQQQAERVREERATALYLLTRELNEATALDQVLERTHSNLEQTFKAPVVIYYAESVESLRQFPCDAQTAGGTDLDRQAVAWVLKHGENAGKSTPNLPLASAFYAPLSTTGGVMGAIGFKFPDANPPSIHQLNLLDSFSQQIAFALDRHRLREVSERAKLLAESERLSKTLLNSMSHEMRTPIAVITSAVNNLAHLEESDGDETRKDIMSAIQHAAERLNRIVGNLLNITRLESGHVKPKLAECEVREVINLALANTDAELAGHKLSVDVPTDLPFVKMDFQLMEQALTNLLSNAASHTSEGTLIEVRARAERQFLVMEVADRGAGIEPESIGRLFDKFYRGPTAPTGGTGLGLSLVKGFVEAQGGSVQADNRPGGGAIFSIRLPLEKVEPAQFETAL